MSERLDKIEKMLLESNISFDKRFNEMVLEDIKRRKIEANERRIEANERRKEEDKRIKKEADERRKEYKERRKEEIDERKKAKKEFDEIFQEMVLEEKVRRKSIEKGLKNTIKIMDGMGLTQGDISEEIIADNFENLFNEIGENISKVERNLLIYTKGRNKRIIGEYDIIGVNGSKIFIGETKTKLTKTHIDKMINTTIPNFKKYDNRYAGMKVYGVVGARVFANRGVLPYAIKHGLYVIKETHKGNAEILKESLVGIRSF